MEEEVLKKIFEYNKRWLFDRKESFNGKTEDYIKRKFKIKEKSTGGVIAGNLIKNNLAVNLKNSMRKEFIESNPSKNKEVHEDILKLSDYCVLTDFHRFQKCSETDLNRPAVAFLTTKRNSLKLKYLEKQEVKYSYISIDYDKVKFGKKVNFVADKELNDCEFFDKRPRNYVKFRKNKEFRENVIIKNITSTQRELIQELIPTHISVKDSDSKNSERYNLMKNFISICNDHYYKTDIFEFFKEQVSKKLKLEINLDEWTYCIVFPDKWCSKEFVDEKSSNYVFEFINSMVSEFNKRYGNKTNLGDFGFSSMNSETRKKNVDKELLFYVTKCFESEDIAEKYIYSEIGSLEEFSVVENGFKKFPDGGYWIKKISYRGKKYIEETEGPYDKKEGEKRVKIIENIIGLKGVPVAKLYKFSDLVCKNDLLGVEQSREIEEYVKMEDRWYPSEGALLFCLSHRMTDVVYFSRANLTQDFTNFSNYAINNGMKFIGSPNYFIFFDPESQKSLSKASRLRSLLNMEGTYKDSHFIWLLDSVLEKEVRRGEEPTIKPFPVSDITQSRDKITYNELKDLYEIIENIDCFSNRLQLSFDQIKTAFDFGFVETYKNEEDDLKTVINMGVVMDSSDSKPKEFRITKNYNDTFEIAIKRVRKRFNDINLVSITEIENCVGYMNINFKNMKDKTWDFSRMSLFNGDIFFNNEIVLIMLTLFVAKCLGVKTVLLDTRSNPTECENKILIQYYIIYYLGIGNFNKFKELGFEILEESEYVRIMDTVRHKNIKQYAIDMKLKAKISNEIKDFTIAEFCRKYIQSKTCPSRGILLLLEEISEEVAKNVFLKIYNNIDLLDFSFIEKYITHNENLE